MPCGFVVVKKVFWFCSCVNIILSVLNSPQRQWQLLRHFLVPRYIEHLAAEVPQALGQSVIRAKSGTGCWSTVTVERFRVWCWTRNWHFVCSQYLKAPATTKLLNFIMKRYGKYNVCMPQKIWFSASSRANNHYLFIYNHTIFCNSFIMQSYKLNYC